jgi:hypothetical protein
MKLPMEQYPIIDISGCIQIDFEQMGTKSKFWYKGESNELWLFKATLSTDKFGNNVERVGENWAEKISCEIAKLLNIPCAEYELASHEGQQGVITKNFVAQSEDMHYGNTLLDQFETLMQYKKEKMGKDNPDTIQQEKVNPNSNHKLTYIDIVLEKFIINKPVRWASLPNIKDANDVFAGYLMFDVLIANQDRHNENWGVIVIGNKHKYLAPTFDHGASLGRNESDKTKEERLRSKDKGKQISKYVTKAKSQVLDKNGRRLKTIDAFLYYSVISRPLAAMQWLSVLENIPDASLISIVKKVPECIMNDLSKEFVINIILENKKRLLELKYAIIELKKEMKS